MDSAGTLCVSLSGCTKLMNTREALGGLVAYC